MLLYGRFEPEWRYRSRRSDRMVLECWNPEPHERPSFHDILGLLDDIASSPFVKTPHESFHVMQNDWKHEIEEMFEELRLKEQVRSDIFLLGCSLVFELCLRLCVFHVVSQVPAIPRRE